MKSKKFSTALIQLAMVASPLSLSAAASAYYSGRRGAYGSGSNKTYLVDPALVGLPKSAFNYSKVHAGNAPAQPLVSGDELVIRKSPVKELLVVDRNIKDYRQFSRLVKPGVELVEIPQGTDGLVYLLETLEHYENLHAVHLFSHARAGELLLGNTPVDGGTLKSHPEFARVVNGAIKTGGDFLLYGCELGKGEAGDEFLEIIKSNTHADVAASDNRTGNAAFNGDWDLEIQKGDIEAKPLANSVAMKDFTEVLQTTTIIFDQSNYITGSGAPTSGIYNSSSNAQFNVYANGTDYVLTADGESGYTGNVIWDYLYNEGGNTYIETKTTFSFSGNAPFKPKSISLWNLTTSHTQDIFITTDNGGLVTVYDVPKQSAAGIANLDISGLPVATKLIITGNIDGNVASNPGSTGEGAGKTYLRFDQLQVDDLGTATAAPTACAPSIGVTDFEGLYSSITELNSGTGSATATVQCFDITSETLNPSHTARVVGTSISGNELLIIQGVGTSPNANLARAIIKSNDGSEFSFRSIKVQPFGNFTDWDIVYNGYKDGVLVSGASLSRNDMSTGVMYTDEFTSIPAFGNVDEIRIEFAATGTSFQNFRIDDIEIGAATATPVNTAPTLTASAGTTAFIEGTAIAIDNALTVTDTDNTTLASATVSISGNFQSGQDVLVFTSNPATMGNITISSNNAGVLTLTSAGATATLAQWQTALRSITYNNTSDNPNTANRTVSFVVNDGTDNSTAATKMVSVTAASDDCIISATIADAANEMTNDLAHFGQSFTACGNGTLSKIKFLSRYNGSLYPQDLTLTIRQGNGLSGDVLGTVTIPQSTIVEDISGTNFTVVDVSSQNIAISNGQFYTFSFEGVDDNRAQLNFGKWILQSAFESFYPGGRMYVGSVAHDDKDLIFEVEIEAGSAPVNTAPSATNLTQSKSFTEDDGSAVALDDIVVTDPDAGETIAATLTLSNVAAGSLSTGTYGSATSTFASGVWTVSGSVADVNVALAAVAFSPAANFDQDFTITARIRDATDTGPADGTISISVTAVNDAPTATNLTQSKSATEGGSAVALDDMVVTDPDTGETITATLTLSNVAAGSLGTGTYGSATSTFASGVWTVTGSVADVNGALAAVAFTPSADNDQNFTITTRIRDAADTGPADGTISFTVTPVNDAPVITAPATIAVTEDIEAALIGISFVDVDAGSGNVTVTLAVASGSLSATTGAGVTVGGTASARTLTGTIADVNTFIAASNVTYTTALNATSNVTLTVSINDNGNTGTGEAQQDSETVTLLVTAVNDAPVITAPATIAVTEDVESALTGISFADVDAGSAAVTATLSVTSGSLSATGGADVTVGGTSSALTLTGSIEDVNEFIAASIVTYTTALNATTDVTLTVAINDGGNTGTGGAQSATETVTLQVTPVNDAPTDITLSAGTILQSATAAGTEVGTLSTTDVDDGEVFTYTLNTTGTAGGTCTDDSGNSSFQLNGNVLETAGPLLPGTYNICVQTSDGEADFRKSFTITVTDDVPPVVSSVSVPADGWYVAGGTLSFTVNTNEAVTVDTGGGTPRIALTVGEETVYASYQSGSGSSELVFAYTVVSGNLDNDGIEVAAAVEPNGGTLRDAENNFLTGALNGVGATTGVLVDAVAPNLQSLSPADGSTTVVPGADFRMTFSENIALGSGNIVIYGALYSPVAIIDAAAHGGQLSITDNQLTINPAADLNELNSYYIQVASGAVTDLAGNAYAGISDLTTWNFTVADVTPPTVTAVAVNGTPSASAEEIQFTVTFNEAPDNVTVDDFTLTRTGSPGGNIADASLSTGNTVTVTIDGITGAGTLRLDVKANSGITDAFGNGNGTNGYVPAFTGGGPHVVDREAPNAPEGLALDPASDSGEGDDGITNDNTPTLTGMAEANATLTVTSDVDGELGTAIADGSGNWSYTPGTPLTEGMHNLTATATDAAGNTSAASAALEITIDTTPHAKPAVPDLAAASDTGESDTDNITNLTDLTLQGAAGSVEANARVHARSDLEGGLTNTTANADGSWSLDVSGLMEGTHQLQITAADTAGNTSVYSDALMVVIDTTAPAGHSVSVDDDVINATEAASIGFTFSEAEAGAVYSYAITSSGGGTPVTGTGTLMTTTDPVSGIDVSGLRDGTLTLSVTVTDVAGNSAIAVTDASMLDQAVPEVEGVENGEYYNEDVTPTFNEGTATLNGEAFTSGTVIADEDEYTLVVTDAAGNADTVNFVVDKTVPEITDVEDGASYNTDVTPAFNEGTARLTARHSLQAR
ncbi:DUF4347 domain-containing protein [Parapedobacter sp. 2B3]|uniref:DUF4347 domain-containing protein n=1 Tax=Parapedobacter sp. 2B3 TaxID=3342381 RepID=UPI0035B5F5CD